MPKLRVERSGVDAFLFHGMDLAGEPQAVGDCPFCGREGKFAANVETGLWRCLVCDVRGNPLQFLRQLHEASMAASYDPADYAALAGEKRLLAPELLRDWGVCSSPILGCWLVPGYDDAGRVVQLYKYELGPQGKPIWKTTTGFSHGLLGVGNFDRSKGTVYVCEGLWDGIALWEVLKGNEGVPTRPLDDANVVAVPGCNVFREEWGRLLAGKRVVLLYDSDHPREHPEGSGKFTQAGLDGERRVVDLLSRASEPPESVEYLRWGEAGYDPSNPSGYDLRDYLSAADTLRSRLDLWYELVERVEACPAEWVSGKSKRAGSVEVDLLPCSDWRTLRNAWVKALKWTDGLDRALSVMLATITTTESAGSQLWVKVLAPPSAGKSVLCEALSINRRYVYPKDTLTGLFSGFQVDREGSENLSLADKLKGKTLAIKDGDTVLQAPNRAQILSQFRALYDRAVRVSYGNKMSQDWEGLSVTVILCGTQSLRALDTSELGERFLDCVIVEEMEEDLEDEIGKRVAYQAAREMSLRVDGKVETRDGPEMVLAKRLTGGYIEWLRTNCFDLFDQVDFPEPALERCQALAKFVAYMRARPSVKQVEIAERELSFRLIGQLVRLAKALALVLNCREVDDEVMRRVHRVALDTARGRTLQLARRMHAAGEEGETASTLALLTNNSPQEEGVLLKFLQKIGAAEHFLGKIEGHARGVKKWRLTPRMRRLYDSVMR